MNLDRLKLSVDSGIGLAGASSGVKHAISEDVDFLEGTEELPSEELLEEPVGEEIPLDEEEAPPEKEEEEPLEEEEEPLEEEEPPKEEASEEDEDGEFDKFAPPDRPLFSEIKKRYPKLFKDFPDMKQMFFREKRFSEIFGSVGHAEAAADRLKDLTWIEGTLMQGTQNGIQSFLSTIKQQNPAAVQNFSSNFLPALSRADMDSYIRVTVPVFGDFLRRMYNQGADKKDANMINSATNAAIFLFGDSRYATGELSLGPQPNGQRDPREAEIERRTAELNNRETQGRQLSFLKNRQDIVARINRTVTGMILNNLDPESVLSDFVKESIVSKVIGDVDNTMLHNPELQRYMETLWAQAARENFSDAARKRIVDAYLSKARKMLPSVRGKYLSAALGTSKKVSSDIRERVRRSSGVPQSGQPGQQRGARTPSAKQIDYKKTSDMDILDGNITLVR